MASQDNKQSTGYRCYRDELFVGDMLSIHSGNDGFVCIVEKEGKFLLERYDIFNDALAITQGKHGFGITEPTAITRVDRQYTVKPVRHHNRQLHKATILKGGIRKSNQAAKYVKGFRLFDKVLYQGQECFIWGRRTSGSFLLRTLDGTKIKDGVGVKYLKLLERSSNYLIA